MPSHFDKQIESIQRVAFELSCNYGGIFHSAAGLRGEIAKMYYKGDDQPMVTQEKMETFLAELLCGRDGHHKVLMDAYSVSGFSFNAATYRGIPPAEVEKHLEGGALSFFYGDAQQLTLLCQKIAAPILKYLHFSSGLVNTRLDSYYDPAVTLGEWLSFVYQIGDETNDPNLKRCYRLISALNFPNDEGDMERVLWGYSDMRPCLETKTKSKDIWKIFWEAAQKHELAYSRLGTDLFTASRIVLDYVKQRKFDDVANDFKEKWMERSRKLSSTEEFILETLQEGCLTGEEIASQAQMSFNSNMKNALSSLYKRLILNKNDNGYFISPDALWILDTIKS